MTSIEPHRTAALAMDFQAAILARLGDAVTPLVARAASVARRPRCAKGSILAAIGEAP